MFPLHLSAFRVDSIYWLQLMLLSLAVFTCTLAVFTCALAVFTRAFALLGTRLPHFKLARHQQAIPYAPPRPTLRRGDKSFKRAYIPTYLPTYIHAYIHMHTDVYYSLWICSGSWFPHNKPWCWFVAPKQTDVSVFFLASIPSSQLFITLSLEISHPGQYVRYRWMRGPVIQPCFFHPHKMPFGQWVEEFWAHFCSQMFDIDIEIGLVAL